MKLSEDTKINILFYGGIAIILVLCLLAGGGAI